MLSFLKISPAMKQSARHEADRLHARHGDAARQVVDAQLAKRGLSLRHRAYLKEVRLHLPAGR